MAPASDVAADDEQTAAAIRSCSPQRKQASSGSPAVGAPPTPALVSQLEARLTATEQECVEIDSSLAAVREKIEVAMRCLRKRPSVNGEEVSARAFFQVDTGGSEKEETREVPKRLGGTERISLTMVIVDGLWLHWLGGRSH